MNPSTISLIIPAYNEEKYIGVCLDYAIKNSEGKLFEIIVVDNASTDKTAEIAQTYEGVKVIHENRKGVMWAREKGRIEAKGNILAYIDADNHMPEGWVEQIEKAFVKDKSLVCLSGPYVYYDIPKWQGFLVKIWWYLSLPFYLLTRYMVVAGNFTIRSDTVERMGGFDTSIIFYGDDTSIARAAHKFGKVFFKFDFIMGASGRRFSKQGIFNTGFLYAGNFFSQIFAKRSITKTARDFR